MEDVGAGAAVQRASGKSPIFSKGEKVKALTKPGAFFRGRTGVVKSVVSNVVVSVDFDDVNRITKSCKKTSLEPNQNLEVGQRVGWYGKRDGKDTELRGTVVEIHGNDVIVDFDDDNVMEDELCECFIDDFKDPKPRNVKDRVKYYDGREGTVTKIVKETKVSVIMDDTGRFPGREVGFPPEDLEPLDSLEETRKRFAGLTADIAGAAPPSAYEPSPQCAGVGCTNPLDVLPDAECDSCRLPICMSCITTGTHGKHPVCPSPATEAANPDVHSKVFIF